MDSPITQTNMFVIMANVEGGGHGVTFMPSDSLGNSWTKAISKDDGSQTKSVVFYSQILNNGTDTVKISFSSSVNNAVLSVWEIRGYDTEGLVTSSGGGSTGCCSVSSVSPIAHSFVLVGAAVQSGNAWTGTSNFTLTHALDWGFEYDVEPPNSTSASLSVTGAQHWDEVLVSFQDPTLGVAPYVAAAGYQTWDASPVDAVEIDTLTQMTGHVSDLGSNKVAAGISAHVPDTGTYSDDYDIQLFVQYLPDGTAHIFAGIYNACWGIGGTCGPVFWTNGQPCNNNYPYQNLCPLDHKQVLYYYSSSIGNFGDQISLRMECQKSAGTLCSSSDNFRVTPFSWLFQYNDHTTGTGWVNATVFTPYGNWTTIKSYITLGTTNLPSQLIPETYWVQVGAIFDPNVPANSDWTLTLKNSEFTVGSSRVDLQACKLEYSIVSPK